MKQSTASAITGATAGGSIFGPIGAVGGGILGYLMGSNDDDSQTSGKVTASFNPQTGGTGQGKTWDTLTEEELKRARAFDDFSDWGE